MLKEVQQIIDRYDRITIITYIKPDADTIATALGIYGVLKNLGKKVELVNPDRNPPVQLDFLPYYSKIKDQINYDQSLIISCAVENIDQLGFDLSQRDIINIDYHMSNTHFGTLNLVDSDVVSLSQVVYELFRNDQTITKDIATCLYTALVSDTQYFTIQNLSERVLDIASEMISFGVDSRAVHYNLKQRQSLASLRILTSTLRSLELHCAGRLAILNASREKILEAGANLSDMAGIIEHAISLATVEIAILLIQIDDRFIRVSFRSKKIDVLGLATHLGGAGDTNTSGFERENTTMEHLKILIKKEIKERGLLDA